MWVWLTDYSLWVLVIAAVLVIVLLFFGDRVRQLIARFLPESKRDITSRRVTAIFWILEGVCVFIMIGAFVAMVTLGDGTTPIVTSEDVKAWLATNGVTIVIILLVSIVLWSALKKLLPPLASNLMARPVPGESKEGIKRRVNTLTGVFLGLGRVIIVVIATLMILSELTVEVGPILAGFGVGGVAVGFGAQYLIRDLIAGIFILMENQYRIGDVAKVAGVSGLVEEINLRKTVLRDIDGIVHHIPNGEIRVASNYSRHYSRINLNVSVAYNTDLDFAIGVINRVCNEMAEEEKWKKIFKTVPSVSRVDKLGDSGIEIKILGDVKPLEQWNAMGELRLRLKRVFDKEGIEIPYPHMKVYFGDKPEK